MEKTVLFFAALAFMGGCCPRRILAPAAVTDSLRTQHEVRYVEKIRDTVIYVRLPAEVKEVEAKRDSSFLQTSLAQSVARVNDDGTLFHSLENRRREEPVTVTVKDTSQTAAETSDKVRIETVEVPVKVPLTWMQKTLMGCGALFFAVIAGGALFWLLRRLLRRR